MVSKALDILFWWVDIPLLQTSEYKTGFTPETFLWVLLNPPPTHSVQVS